MMCYEHYLHNLPSVLRCLFEQYLSNGVHWASDTQDFLFYNVCVLVVELASLL